MGVLVRLIGDEGHRTAISAGGGGGLGWGRLAGVVDADVQIALELAEELTSLARDGLVEVARNLQGLGWFLFGQVDDVVLRLLNVSFLTSDFDCGVCAALSRNVDGDAELLLEALLGFTATANQRPVLVGGYINRSRNLALTESNKILDLLDEVIDNGSTTLQRDGVSIGLLLRELDETGALPRVIGAASLGDQFTQVGAYSC